MSRLERKPLDTPERVEASYNHVPEDDKARVRVWLQQNFTSSKTLCEHFGTYGLKHVFEHAPDGVYMTETEFKGALLAEGFKPAYTDPEISSDFYLKPKHPRWERVPGHPHYGDWLKRKEYRESAVSVARQVRLHFENGRD